VTCDLTRPVGEFNVAVLKEKSLENALFLGFNNELVPLLPVGALMVFL
jgi:hypothetical protein